MAREGIQRATTRAICSEAGVHQSLFHYSFSSKRELFEELVRKAMTDLCYMVCARKLLAARNRLYPQFATHNALTVASVIEDAGGVEGFEFQRLYGMGEALYAALAAELPHDAVDL